MTIATGSPFFHSVVNRPLHDGKPSITPALYAASNTSRVGSYVPSVSLMVSAVSGRSVQG